MEAPITPTCKPLPALLAVLAATLPLAPAGASANPLADPAALRATYVSARTAEILGQGGRAAELFAGLAASDSSSQQLQRRAITGAIGAGRLDLALSLSRAMVRADAQLPLEGRLLLIADALHRGQPAEATLLVDQARGRGAADFVSPYLRAWIASDGSPDAALAELDRLPKTSPLISYYDEHRALLLLKAGRAAEAEVHARRALGTAGARDSRLRLAFADGFMAAGAPALAAEMLKGKEADLPAAVALVARGKRPGHGIATPAQGFSELLQALAIDLNKGDDRELPLALSRLARMLDPASGEATLLTALFLEQLDQRDEGLALLAAVPADDPLIGDIRDTRVRMLLRAKRPADAVALASGPAAAANANSDDFARLGDALAGADRHAQAADAYGRALALGASLTPMRRWPLLLLQADQLEQADRWPEARAVLDRAMAIAPEEAVLLNFMGYAMLERGEQTAAAGAMIARASALAPDNASITDSLGWAQYKQGKVDAAIATLQRAAAADPAQAEIQEHLGDALFTAGRRFEARYAWRAALLTAEDEMTPRLNAKIEAGLSRANAAP